VILTSLILACTNIPKEIESRVIYTIVTKPTTRLELVVGKVIGFARVSLAIVVIMGLFTWVYMRISSEQKRQQIAYRLKEGDVSDTEAARLTEYNHTGLLTARSFWTPDELNIFGAPPDPKSPIRVISNQADEDIVAGFAVDRSTMFGPPPPDANEDWVHQGAGENGLVIRVRLSYVRTGPAEDQPKSGKLGPVFGKAADAPMEEPPVTIDLLDANMYSMVSSPNIVGGSTPAELMTNIQAYTASSKVDPQRSAAVIRLSDPVKQADGTMLQYAYAWLSREQVMPLFNQPRFFIHVAGIAQNVNYLVGPNPVSCFVPVFKTDNVSLDGAGTTQLTPLPGPEAEPELVIFRGKMGLHLDQEMDGGSDAPGATADFFFRNAPPSDTDEGQIPFQLTVEVTRSNSEIESGREDATQFVVAVLDTATGKITPVKEPVLIESRFPAFFKIPADSITSGNYQILLHCVNSQQTVGMTAGSLQLIQSRQLFEFNLAKSLSIVWMMSILVIVLSVMCSTFLSWPIALVLTVMLLLGHWGVDQLADSTGPGLGRQIVNDFKFTDVALSNVVSNGVDNLSRALTIMSRGLPDTSQFDAIGDIEEGNSVTAASLWNALSVMGGFGLPALVLAYVIMRGKEVAP
jgi:hypothetical protein